MVTGGEGVGDVLCVRFSDGLGRAGTGWWFFLFTGLNDSRNDYHIVFVVDGYFAWFNGAGVECRPGESRTRK